MFSITLRILHFNDLHEILFTLSAVPSMIVDAGTTAPHFHSSKARFPRLE